MGANEGRKIKCEFHRHQGKGLVGTYKAIEAATCAIPSSQKASAPWTDLLMVPNEDQLAEVGPSLRRGQCELLIRIPYQASAPCTI